ncbi:hypothetical protein P280DRAFT_405457 [Massarina eburnea CBS 473.64]|uniref:Uncharacterized protein n=1 Tax=Massarina eburnea CBS 473.64 TaxID=1395130 RepID=A0A6A6RRK0_9PLEO|nr:hypothetical protein P280DRAFT_405457 [Massarina eburnea CBS 473.64]
MSLRKASTALLAQRTVHLRIVPRPSNLSESREIMRVLQRFGPMDLFKHLRYEYHNPMDNVALGIYRMPDSAQQALNATPIRFALEKYNATSEMGEAIEGEMGMEGEDAQDAQYNADATPDSNEQAKDTENLDDMLRPSKLLNRTISESESPPATDNPPASKPLPFETPAKPPKSVSKWFQITVDRSRTVHQDYIETQPYWAPFTPMKSSAQHDLENKVPHWGLSDVTKRPPNAHRTPNRILRKLGKEVESGIGGLWELWEEGRSGNAGH